jgi:hypothetical protein
LLSLVRSNEFLGIGFLENKNRLVVALSRARRGLFIFGNAVTLTSAESIDQQNARETIWDPLIQHMGRDGSFNMDGGMPITCSNHRNTVEIFEADQWHGLAGGCQKKCLGKLRCGHDCPYSCHPFDHDFIVCQVLCLAILACGHVCGQVCGKKCICHNQKCAVSEMDTLSLQSEKLDLMTDDTGATRHSNDIRMMPGKFPTTGINSARNPWAKWDAKKHDNELGEERRRVMMAKPKLNLSDVMAKEKFIAVKIKDGIRVRDSKASNLGLVQLADVDPETRSAAATGAQSAPEKLNSTLTVTKTRLAYFHANSNASLKNITALEPLAAKTGTTSEGNILQSPLSPNYFPGMKSKTVDNSVNPSSVVFVSDTAQISPFNQVQPVDDLYSSSPPPPLSKKKDFGRERRMASLLDIEDLTETEGSTHSHISEIAPIDFGPNEVYGNVDDFDKFEEMFGA